MEISSEQKRRRAGSGPASAFEASDPHPGDELAARALKGRGAVGNPTGRFEKLARQATDDGWGNRPGDDADAPPPLRTTVTPDASRSVITRNTSPDIPFDRSINPYRGCEHGCIYCYARPSHAFLGLSPGLDFESRLFAKHDVARLLRAELARPGYRAAPVALGTNTDPYQPIERRHKLMRQILGVMVECGHPLTIVTKSDAILRDLDLLGELARRNLVRVMISVTTLDRALARKLEPRAAVPERRLAAIGELAKAAVPVGVMAAPVIPVLTDPELESILERAAAAGAHAAGYTLLRLPGEVQDMFGAWLAAHAPLKAEHVLSLVRQTRGGKLYDPQFGKRMRGEDVYAQLIADRFAKAARRLGLGGTRALDTTQFRAPGGAPRQLSLL